MPPGETSPPCPCLPVAIPYRHAPPPRRLSAHPRMQAQPRRQRVDRRPSRRCRLRRRRRDLRGRRRRRQHLLRTHAPPQSPAASSVLPAAPPAAPDHRDRLLSALPPTIRPIEALGRRPRRQDPPGAHRLFAPCRPTTPAIPAVDAARRRPATKAKVVKAPGGLQRCLRPVWACPAPRPRGCRSIDHAGPQVERPPPAAPARSPQGTSCAWGHRPARSSTPATLIAGVLPLPSNHTANAFSSLQPSDSPRVWNNGTTLAFIAPHLSASALHLWRRTPSLPTCGTAR